MPLNLERYNTYIRKKKTCRASSLLIFAHASLNTVRTESVEPVKDVISHRRLSHMTKINKVNRD